MPPVSNLLGPPAYTEDALLTGDVFEKQEVDLKEEDILNPSAEMRAFLDSLPAETTAPARLENLLRAFAADNFSIFYDPDATISAAEAYSQQRGNCLAFSALIVAMARELGVEAHFNEVFVPPTWYLDRDQMVLYQHINAAINPGQNTRVIDFNFTAGNPNFRQRRLTDNQALAKFYSNLAADFLRDKAYGKAFYHQRKALDLAPEDADLWSNLGVIYRAAGHPERGMAAYQVALSLDADNLSTLTNLQRALRDSNRLQEADLIAQRLNRYRRKNPYYWYTLALQSYSDADYEVAAAYARDAMTIDRNDHRFHFLLGMARYQMGAEGYRRNFRHAMELVGEGTGLRQYQRKMALIGEDIQPREPDRFSDRVDQNIWHRWIHFLQ
ncbi:transglutaminase domain-containing protein [Microbulbifer sp. TYP-18]|uniref:transglutaminase domain-containing protein n=1 Tax=Microbulbifer sp. TYP-18 TaxID=3230024 RepID=UPI0034C6B1F1